MNDTCEYDPTSTPQMRSSGGRVGRRGLFRRLGAGGLGVAAVMFGRPAVAQAATCGCCHLVNCPPNTTFGNCNTYPGHYTWYCNLGVNQRCACCERSGGARSAYKCWVI